MNDIIKERILRNLKKNAAAYFYSDPYIALTKMYLEDPNGCIPEAYLGDDINKNIYDKFYAVLDSVREETGNRDIEIYIDVSYEDSTKYMMVLGDRVLLKDYRKAWNFWWETEESLMEELYSMYTKILAKIIGGKVWPCWNLSEEDIKMIAEEKDLSLEGKDLEEIAQKTKKGIETALGEWPWDIIVEEAIITTV